MLHLQQLRAQMAAVKQQLQSKRKFAFSRATKKARVASVTSVSTQQEAALPLSQTAVAAGASSLHTPHTAKQKQQTPAALSAHELQLINAGYGCMGLCSQTIGKAVSRAGLCPA